MSKLSFFFFSAIAVVSIFGTGCASLTGFQTGRTVGQNNGEVMLSLNASQTPDFDWDFDMDDTSDIPTFYFPNLELSGRYGIVDRFDMGLRMNTNLNVALDGRFQFVGDQTSPVAVATGLSVGSFGLISGLWNVQIPLYFSIHPKESLAIYLNPRYTRQFATGFDYGSVSYYGFNAGILIGKDVQFGMDAGMNQFDTQFSNVETLLNFGIGLKVPLGQSERVKD
jgi:hypothetical protein